LPSLTVTVDLFAYILTGAGAYICLLVLVLILGLEIWDVFLRAKSGTAVVRLSHRHSISLSVHHMGGSVKNGAS